MKPAAAITGVGLVTVLGDTAESTWDALLAGRSIAEHTRIPGFTGSDRILPMSHRAASEALSQAVWKPADCRDAMLVVGTSKGAIESWLTHEKRGRTPFYPASCSYLGLSQLDCHLAQSLHFDSGPRLTLSSACSSGLHALIRAAMAIESGEVQRALVVAAEASVHPLFISSFRRLGVLAPEGHGCRPFDQNRKGFILSEAAAAVCLEVATESRRGLATIDRWSIGSDATHLTAGDPQSKTLRRILAEIAAGPIDLIHAHATGTIINDPAELAAIEDALTLTLSQRTGRGEKEYAAEFPPHPVLRGRAGEGVRARAETPTLTLPRSTGGGDKNWERVQNPILYSHKAALGHSLGAAGLVSVVLNCLCHRHGRVPGNIRSSHPLPTPGLRFSTSQVERSIHRSIAMAAGFGGPIAAVSILREQG